MKRKIFLTLALTTTLLLTACGQTKETAGAESGSKPDTIRTPDSGTPSAATPPGSSSSGYVPTVPTPPPNISDLPSVAENPAPTMSPLVLNFLSSLQGATDIVSGVFQNTPGLTELKDVVLPDSVIMIRENAFENCSWIESIQIPNSLRELGDYAFSGCTGLEKITFAETGDPVLMSVPPYAFKGCTSLTEITIPESVCFISEGAFYGCESLKEIVIPGNVCRIGENAFTGCSRLERITFAGDIPDVERNAFEECARLDRSLIWKETPQPAEPDMPALSKDLSPIVGTWFCAPALTGEGYTDGFYLYISENGSYTTSVGGASSIYAVGDGTFRDPWNQYTLEEYNGVVCLNCYNCTEGTCLMYLPVIDGEIKYF